MSTCIIIEYYICSLSWTAHSLRLAVNDAMPDGMEPYNIPWDFCMHGSHLDYQVRGIYWSEIVGRVEQGYTHMQVTAADIKKGILLVLNVFFVMT